MYYSFSQNCYFEVLKSMIDSPHESQGDASQVKTQWVEREI